MPEVSDVIHQGGIIAYPTEAVYGLGCDPFNENAVRKLCEIKQRSLDKGLILIASKWEQIADLVQAIPEERMQIIEQSWPGPVTWVFPASDKVPHWVRGDTQNIALRITNHPIAKKICEECGHAIVSTSANISKQEACRSQEEVESVFGDLIDQIVPGAVGGSEKPSDIFNALSGEQLR